MEDNLRNQKDVKGQNIDHEYHQELILENLILKMSVVFLLFLYIYELIILFHFLLREHKYLIFCYFIIKIYYYIIYIFNYPFTDNNLSMIEST